MDSMDSMDAGPARMERLRTLGAGLALGAAIAVASVLVLSSTVPTAGVVLAFGLMVCGFSLYAWDSPARTVRRGGHNQDPRSQREQRWAAMIWALAWAPAALVVIAVHSLLVTVVIVVTLVGFDPVWLRVARGRAGRSKV